MSVGPGLAGPLLAFLDDVQSLHGPGVGWLSTEQIAGSLVAPYAQVAGALADLHARGLVARRAERFGIINGEMAVLELSWHVAPPDQLSLF